MAAVASMSSGWASKWSEDGDMKIGTSHAPEVLCDWLTDDPWSCLRSNMRENLLEMLCLMFAALP